MLLLDRPYDPEVSILARPEGRALPTTITRPSRRTIRVSILARPEGRALQGATGGHPEPRKVSILARPEGRALHARYQAPLYRQYTFQSSPGPKAGRSLVNTVPATASASVFQSSPARRPGAPWARSGPSLRASTFQSSPGPKAGRSGRGRRRRGRLRRGVSILARPEGRALRPGPAPARSPAARRFNPRPARRPGAPGRIRGLLSALSSFNPRPARRPGAPEDVAGHDARGGLVSILARPEGRALPGVPLAREPHQPAGFNPRPARRPGAPPVVARLRAHRALVSILARPEGRALRSARWRRRHAASRFNPRPARRPGAPPRACRTPSPSPHRFNPRPARRPGAPDRHHYRGGDATACFNPRPARRPGAPSRIPSRSTYVSWEFQSLPGPKAGRSRASDAGDASYAEVSILARPEGRALHGGGCRRPSRVTGFNPRPARRPGAPCALPRGDVEGTIRFNPRPARRPGAPGRHVRQIHRGLEVSILARPEGRALLCVLVGRRYRPHVSILARPEGRALRSPRRGSAARSRDRFNPRPARRPGAPVLDLRDSVAQRQVSILARPEGRALHSEPERPAPEGRGVSILARPEGRALPADARRHHPGAVPVSILARPEGRALPGPITVQGSPADLFQSSPGPKAGRSSHPAAGPRRRPSGFNPRPARRPGAPPAATSNE